MNLSKRGSNFFQLQFLFSCVLLCVIITLIPLLNANPNAYSYSSQAVPIDSFMTDGYSYSFVGEGMFNYAGIHMYGIGDINNDSYDDFIIGASQYGGTQFLHGYGKAYLFLGRPTHQWSSKSLYETEISFVGETINDTLGRWIAGLGDVNGDGFDDFAISAVGHGNWSGKTYVFFGGSTISWGSDTPVSQAANASFIGAAEEDWSGHGIYGVGDVNNDGLNDLLISAEWNDEGGLNSGQVYLIFGRPSNQWTKDTHLPQAANASFIGNTTLGALGMDAGAIGDVNKDNYTDFAIGALKHDISIDLRGYPIEPPPILPSRQVFIILGRPSHKWQMSQPISESNASMLFEEVWGPSSDWISGLNDVNGDGFDDFIVGAYMDDSGGKDAGRSYLYFGRSIDQSSVDLFSQANVSIIGEPPNVWSGLTVAGAGDMNNDGYNDILIGGTNLTDFFDEGSVQIFYGRPTNQWQSTLTISDADHYFVGENVGDAFGWMVAGVGDVNNDGFSDVMMSAVLYAVADPFSIPGKAYLLLVTPKPIIVSPTTTTYTTDTITVDLSSKWATTFWYYIEGIDSTNQTWNTAVTRNLADGAYTLHAYGVDNAGNEAHTVVTFTIDTTTTTTDTTTPTNDTTTPTTDTTTTTTTTTTKGPTFTAPIYLIIFLGVLVIIRKHKLNRKL
jgi:hypothetical protein